jgi:hypothetical protein
MPVLGIIASQISGHLFAPSGAYDSIATATGTGASGVITFSSIPSTYTHLQVRAITQSSQTYLSYRFNGDTGSNYAYHYFESGSSTPSVGGGATQNLIYMFGSSSATTSVSGVFVLDILDYTNTNKYKTTRSLSGNDANGAGFVDFNSGLWQNTSAITSLTITAFSGNFSTNSSFALYGIKGA